ncbi:hypothetical protein [Streptomyces sp. Wb2n-11]|uniref:hypothetical protein n=1 Tax=Streptomyces sp. Wb2n-11 TaxID=1030533 RepID=UPI000A8DA8BE|nr:hypothetical protein [Streptomyces sp. Wb2n-11]
MTTPETRARLRTLKEQLTTPTPEPLAGQAALPLNLTWQQGALFDEGRPIPPSNRTEAPHE